MCNNIITVYHGTKNWVHDTHLYAPCINYMLGRGKSSYEAIEYAKGLNELLNDFVNHEILNIALYNAQVTGLYNPFLSTSRNRTAAESFAGTPGFLLTICGPEDNFFDFNKVRENNHIPHRPEFKWLEEMGIPIKLESPFKLMKVEEILNEHEEPRCVYERENNP